MGGNAADIEIRARAFWADTEGGEHAVGFAASEDPEDGYVIFEGRPGDRKGLYLEVSDEIFAAKDAVEGVSFSDAGFVLTIRTAMQARSTPPCSEHRSPDSRSGSIGTTRSGK